MRSGASTVHNTSDITTKYSAHLRAREVCLGVFCDLQSSICALRHAPISTHRQSTTMNILCRRGIPSKVFLSFQFLSQITNSPITDWPSLPSCLSPSRNSYWKSLELLTKGSHSSPIKPGTNPPLSPGLGPSFATYPCASPAQT